MKNNQIDIIVGAGEVGKSLFKVLRPYYSVKLIDRGDVHFTENIRTLHIGFPYSQKFIDEVKRYKKKYKPEFTIIHSTVPVGTSRKCGAIHSPIIGMHPFLRESIKTFIKFIGGENAGEVADYFRKAGIKVYLFDKSETTELGKIAQTSFYALMIEYIKDLKKECDKNNLSFAEVYTLFAENYNQGYRKLGCPEYVMPLLIPIMTKQGGHCTIPNLNFWNTKFTKFIKKIINNDHKK